MKTKNRSIRKKIKEATVVEETDGEERGDA